MVESEKCEPVGPTPIRESLLRAGIDATCGDRNKSYGDPVHQLGLAGKIKDLLREDAMRLLSPAEWEALDMVVTKLSRAVCGGQPGKDTFIDGAVYFAIAGEAYLTAQTEKSEQAIRGEGI